MSLLTKNNIPVNFVQQKAKCCKRQKIENSTGSSLFIDHDSTMKKTTSVSTRIFCINSSDTSSSTDAKKQSRESKQECIKVSSKANTRSYGDNDNNKRNEHNNIPPVNKIKISRNIKHGRFVSSNIVSRFIVAQQKAAHHFSNKHTIRFLLPLPCCGFASAHKHLPVCIGLFKLCRGVTYGKPVAIKPEGAALALWGAVNKYTASSFLIPKFNMVKIS